MSSAGAGIVSGRVRRHCGAMAFSLEIPRPPRTVAAVFAGFPEASRRVLLSVRDLVFAAAADDRRIGALTETLKWSEPAYLTEASGSGSTLRLGLTRQEGAPAMFVNCRTTLVGEIRDRCGDVFRYDGARAVILPEKVAAEAVRHAAHLALTYHLRRSR